MMALNFLVGRFNPMQVLFKRKLQKALTTVLREPIRIMGSGRTDQGVHAKGQVAHFEMDHCLDQERVLLSLNGILPMDIRIKSLESVPLDFHACYSAKTKIYHYHLWLEPVIDPILHRYRLHMRKPLDLKLIQQATAHFIGVKDFTTLCKLKRSRCFL